MYGLRPNHRWYAVSLQDGKHSIFPLKGRPQKFRLNVEGESYKRQSTIACLCQLQMHPARLVLARRGSLNASSPNPQTRYGKVWLHYPGDINVQDITIVGVMVA